MLHNVIMQHIMQHIMKHIMKHIMQHIGIISIVYNFLSTQHLKILTLHNINYE